MWYYIVLSVAVLFSFVLGAVIPPDPDKDRVTSRWYYDLHYAEDHDQLVETLHTINESGYHLVSVTQDMDGIYTVFFGRPEP